MTKSLSGFDSVADAINSHTSSLAEIAKNPLNPIYGAKGDGVTDDTTSIKNAIASFSSSGGLLLLPYGSNFKITGTINIPANVTVFGYGATVTGGAFTSFSITGNAPTSISVSSLSGNTVTVGSTTGLSVGQIVQIKGQYVSIYSEIVSISGTTVTIADYVDFTIGGTLNLYTTTKMNVEIKGVKFTGCTSGWDISIDGSTNPLTHVTVDECIFDNSIGVTLSKVGYATVKQCSFFNVGDSSFCNDTSYCQFLNNKYLYFSHGIRSQYSTGLLVQGNILKNGKSSSYSVGIEISGSDGSNVTQKNTQNRILNNQVINAQQGVSGSGIGGIHLNFNAKNNIVQGNISNNNGIGIYLENTASFNTIADNVCNNNGGYYGVGIELDFDCSDNIITRNTCNNNAGSSSALESAGIEVRNGSSSGHDNMRNIVSHNKCTGNARAGIMVAGSYTQVVGNQVSGNGTGGSAFAPTAEILVPLDGVHSIINENTVIEITGGSQYGIYGHNPSDLKINENHIEVSGSAINALLLDGTINNVRIESNDIDSQASQRGLYLNATSGAQVYVRRNRINHTSNGYAAYEIDNISSYDSERNVLTGSSTQSTFYQSTAISTFV